MGGEFSEIDDEVAGGLFEEVCWREEVWPGRQGEASWQMAGLRLTGGDDNLKTFVEIDIHVFIHCHKCLFNCHKCLFTWIFTEGRESQ